MSNTSIQQVCARLDADKQWSAFFDIMRDYGDALCAVWLKEEKELSETFAEMTRRADDLAAYLTANTPEGGWIAISVDTCHNWPALFWGVIRSGHNALLLDASASDDMTQSLLEEAGCKVIISRKPRGLTGDIRQIDYKAVAGAPRTIGFTPVWGEYVAMCTCGTTGRSRIFAYSGTAVCEQALAILQRKALAFLPFHHVLGFMANVILVPFCGATNVYLPSFPAEPPDRGSAGRQQPGQIPEEVREEGKAVQALAVQGIHRPFPWRPVRRAFLRSSHGTEASLRRHRFPHPRHGSGRGHPGRKPYARGNAPSPERAGVLYRQWLRHDGNRDQRLRDIPQPP